MAALRVILVFVFGFGFWLIEESIRVNESSWGGCFTAHASAIERIAPLDPKEYWMETALNEYFGPGKNLDRLERWYMSEDGQRVGWCSKEKSLSYTMPDQFIRFEKHEGVFVAHYSRAHGPILSDHDQQSPPVVWIALQNILTK